MNMFIIIWLILLSLDSNTIRSILRWVGKQLNSTTVFQGEPDPEEGE